jgi:predicted CXXCH cytochrome family protein
MGSVEMRRDVPLMASVLGLLLLPLPAFAQQQAAGSSHSVTSVRQYDSACGQCHKNIYERYMTTPMANASGLASDRFIPGTYSDPSSGVTYEVFERDGAVWLRYDRSSGRILHGEQRLEYFMGSGSHALTYLYSINDYWFETPIAYYQEKHGYDLRPSLQGQKEMSLNLAQDFECMHCHVNGAQPEDRGTLNHYSAPPFLHGGIACEDCHGDAAAHVATKGKSALLDLAKLEPDRKVSVCVLCHLEGDASIPHRGRSLSNFKPGEDIADYVSYFVRPGAANSRRGVSQVEGLYSSMCMRASGDKMSCMSCHDPHYTPTPQERTAFYRAKCLACHTDLQFAATHFPTEQDCTSCHMPKRQSPDLAHSIWTDHRILERPDEAPPETPAKAAALVPMPGIVSKVTPRDVALAYYQLAAGGDESAAERAWPLLLDVVKSDPGDSEALAALGFLAYVHGDQERAFTYFDSALSFDPDNLDVAVDYGALLVRHTQAERARDLWERVFENNRDVTELGMNLATLQCMLGQQKAAEDALRQVLIYDPDHRAARDELGELESGRRICSSGQK